MSNNFYINRQSDINETKEREKNKLLLSSEELSTKSIVFVEDHLSYKDLLIHAFFDGVAFFFVTIGIYLSIGKPETFIFSFWSVFMIFGNLSGAHINAMVTVSLWIYNGKLFSAYNLSKLIFYIVAQLIGVMLGNIFCLTISNYDVFYVEPKDISEVKQFIAEAFFSGTLVFVALFISSASTRPTKKNYINLTLLAVWLYIIIKDGGNVSGGNYNPTVYLILNGIARFYHKKMDAFDDFWALAIAPFVGGILFMLLFKYLFRPYYIKNHSKYIEDVE